MDFRRIIAFGKSSHVVSLPKHWLTENSLNKGDLVYLEQDFDKLIIMPKEKNEDKEERKAIINVDNKEFKLIKREISSAFVNYNDYIVLKGKNLHKYAKDIVKVIHNLIALEIMEQSAEKIIARDFLKVEDIKIVDYFKKEDIITRSMFVDLMDPEFVNYDDLIERQNSVKRVYLLLLKVFKAISKNTVLIKKTDLSLDEIFKYYRFNFAIQRIAHSLKVISENMKSVTDKSTKEELSSLISNLNKHYLDVMKALHSKNKDLAYELSEKRDKYIEIINESKVKRTPEISIIIERMVWIFFELHETLHIVYN
ncbi:hypothetical protein KY334_01640 [Candidatus Woesearchaeota archaeon]|nr:hypothetical protein [Candidatus Woesearchaeota archaeon]